MIIGIGSDLIDISSVVHPDQLLSRCGRRFMLAQQAQETGSD